jgi:hypothetical protein
MSPQGSREVVERYAKAMVERDFDLEAEVCTADVVNEFPQSGERVRGHANVRAVNENYPGGLPWDILGKVIGSEDKWVLTPSFSLLRIEGTGDVYTLLGSATYPDGKRWHIMSLIELRSGKIAKVTSVFGAPFDPPEWRARWVERIT